jgi:cobalt-zinc-cadmium efflux system outer membrane protein
MCGWGRALFEAIRARTLLGGVLLLELCGCGSIAPPIGFRRPPDAPYAMKSEAGFPFQSHRTPNLDSTLVQPTGPAILPISAQESVSAIQAAIPVSPVGIDEFVRLAIEKNPRIAKATFAIDAARGRYIQVGLYPNPELGATWDEIGDRTGPGGILTIPRLTQQIVTGHKLSLSQRVAATEVDRSSIAVMAERYAVIGTVRATYCETLALERRIEILGKLVQLADEAVQYGKNLLENKQIARLDLLQLEVERERFRAEFEAAGRELPSLGRKLAAAVGDPRLPIGQLRGSMEMLPNYDPNATMETILATHPDLRIARIGVDRAQAAAEAELGAANFEVARVENDLTDRIATSFRIYSSAQTRAERYRMDILPRAEETHDLSLKAFKGGQFEYLRVIQAQRAVAEARLEYNKSLGEAWKAAADLSGLLLEESWLGPSSKSEPGKQPK